MFDYNKFPNVRKCAPPKEQVAQQIPSKYESVRKVVDTLLQLLDQQNWEEDEKFCVHLAVEEALVNAIKHGNRSDKTKSVDVSYCVTSELFEIQITDKGEGFVPAAVPDPTDESRLDLPSGRGLLLMRTYMTSVVYNSDGNSVHMQLDRSGDKR